MILLDFNYDANPFQPISNFGRSCYAITLGANKVRLTVEGNLKLEFVENSASNMRRLEEFKLRLSRIPQLLNKYITLVTCTIKKDKAFCLYAHCSLHDVRGKTLGCLQRQFRKIQFTF